MKTVRARFQSLQPLRVSPVLTLELAVTPAERARGLMGRAQLLRHEGMLFVFTKPDRHGFWMKNTGLPLDIAWLSTSGVVQETAHLHPYDETLRMPRGNSKYAIELIGGALDFYGVKLGDQLVLLKGS